MRYWHGLGRCDDLDNLTMIRPAHELGVAIRDGVPHDWGNYVYLTSSEEAAQAFTALANGHTVVEVDTTGLVLEPDPDFGTLGLRVRGPVPVRSVTPINPRELPHARNITKILSPDHTWPGGLPKYTQDGYLQFPQQFLDNGYTNSDFHWLGRWWPIDFLIPGDDARVTALTDDNHMYHMYPENHPDLQGRRRIPDGTLEGAWTATPGYCPPSADLLMSLQIIIKWDQPRARTLTHKPWEW